MLETKRAHHDRAIILAGLTVITAASWGYLCFDAWRMSHGESCCAAFALPRMHRWPLSDLLMLFVMWAVMMVAMMTPTAAPMVLLFAAINRRCRAEEKPYVPTGIFLLGYLLIWTGFSLLATLLQWGLHSAALLSPAMLSTSPWLGGGLLIAAGIFQFTPLKHACLRHCRSPLDFLLTEWRDGPRGAMVMGLRQGLSCAVCCWLLMALLFVLGVMNLLWVAALTAFVLIEKLGPAPKLISRVTGALCIAWGIAMILGRWLSR